MELNLHLLYMLATRRTGSPSLCGESKTRLCSGSNQDAQRKQPGFRKLLLLCAPGWEYMHPFCLSVTIVSASSGNFRETSFYRFFWVSVLSVFSPVSETFLELLLS
eukprot:TRINITY_DN1532_c0_g1_i2.p1 TRINITY_DN1532_c0_g1~~TRINITY_DN1532_c0_g1_i2.p1  ORF type:complete len:106 (-),score=0.78 TRINITY_DN1532_c0_g1_i2:1252-1569(-)